MGPYQNFWFSGTPRYFETPITTDKNQEEEKNEVDDQQASTSQEGGNSKTKEPQGPSHNEDAPSEAPSSKGKNFEGYAYLYGILTWKSPPRYGCQDPWRAH